MRILLLSDIHANPWALRAVCAGAGPVDHVLCAGDTVNYGPDPNRAIAWLRTHQAISVLGNHDHAVAFRADPKGSSAKAPVALAMRDWTREQLEPADMAWLVSLKRQILWEVGGVRFMIVHASPLDPLYDIRLKPTVSESLLAQLTHEVKADVLVVGHTHRPLLRQQHNLTIVNPGTVGGAPYDGDPRAAYAIWDDGQITLRRADYDRNAVFDALAQLPLDPKQIEILQKALFQGSIT
jgi:putative phosphoesterase